MDHIPIMRVVVFGLEKNGSELGVMDDYRLMGVSESLY